MVEMQSARGARVSASRPLRRVAGEPSASLPDDVWPGSVPAVQHILTTGLDLGALTILVGDNGAGKSTLVEAIAVAFGMSPEGGSTGARHTTRATESELHDHLRLTRGIGGDRWGFFLRAETMHGFYSYLEQNPNPGAHDAAFHEMSHGESFLEILSSRFGDSGLYVLDEPEAALSFDGCLALVGILKDIGQGNRAQAIVATHSPIVAATPGAEVYELGAWGLRASPWRDLRLVQNWKLFLDDPQRYLRHFD